MSNDENDTPETAPMTLEERAAKYASPGQYRNPKTGKFAKQPTGITPARRRRLKHKENHAIAVQVRLAEAKVAKLRGAAKTSAQKTLDRLKKLFK